MSSVLLLLFHRDEEKAHAHAGHELECRKLEDQQRRSGAKRGGQVRLQAGDGGVVQVAVEGERYFVLAGSIAFLSDSDRESAHILSGSSDLASGWQIATANSSRLFP